MTDQDLEKKIRKIFEDAEKTYPDNQEMKWQSIATWQQQLIHALHAENKKIVPHDTTSE